MPTTFEFGVRESKDKLGGDYPVSPENKDGNRMCYPSVTFRAEQMPIVKEWLGGMPEVGDEIEVTVRMRIKTVSDGQSDYEKRCEMDIISADDVNDMGDAGDPEDTNETDSGGETPMASSKMKPMGAKKTMAQKY